MEGGKALRPWEIDDRDLYEEWRKQAKMSREVGGHQVEAKYQLKKAQARTKLVYSRLRMAIRMHPDQYGFGGKKPTKDEVDDAAEIHEDYQKAVAEEIEAQKTHDDSEVIVIAVTHDRRKSLENMVELLRLNYASERDHDTSVRRNRDAPDRELLRGGSKGVEYDPNQ